MKDIKKVAVLYSGGKDSNYAVQFCKEKGWEIQYLLSVKPNRKDCYLFHYAAVEHTPLQAQALGLKHVLVDCKIADPVKEAGIVKKVVEKNKVDAVVLGGTGLQVTQLQSIQRALLPLGIEVFASHAGEEHGELFEDMLDKGYKIMIAQFASDGLSKWLGKIVDKDNFGELRKDSIRYGFHLGFEGGYADTFVLDMPLFKKKVELKDMMLVRDSECTGHILVDKASLVDKKLVIV
ncbi:MAG TPA: diphthine--ammonia ligase [Candidatus Nanoarchaeia archaeon]|nr:diphthine--ammonia ligase [Candidatus Nanoarchaeia archaeon]